MRVKAPRAQVPPAPHWGLSAARREAEVSLVEAGRAVSAGASCEGTWLSWGDNAGDELLKRAAFNCWRWENGKGRDNLGKAVPGDPSWLRAEGHGARGAGRSPRWLRRQQAPAGPAHVPLLKPCCASLPSPCGLSRAAVIATFQRGCKLCKDRIVSHLFLLPGA